MFKMHSRISDIPKVGGILNLLKKAYLYPKARYSIRRFCRAMHILYLLINTASELEEELYVEFCIG